MHDDRPRAGQHANSADVYLWVHRVGDIVASEASHVACLGVLDPEERQQHARLFRREDRAHYALAHALLRGALSHHVGGAVPPDGWRFTRSPTGQPRLSVPRIAQQLYFSLTHCTGLVACAIAGHPQIGVDAEPRRRVLANARGVAGLFSCGEQEALSRCRSPTEHDAMVLRLWTLKEAFAKAMGLGLTLSLDASSFTFGPPLRACLAAAGMSRQSWRFDEWHLWTDHLLALARGVGVSGDNVTTPHLSWVDCPARLCTATLKPTLA